MAEFSAPKGEPDTDADLGGSRHCRCPLCGKMIVAASMEECVAHMQSCSAFAQVHPTTAEGGTEAEPNMAFFEKEKAAMKANRTAAQAAARAAPNPQPKPQPKPAPPGGAGNPFSSAIAAERSAEDIAAMNIKELRRHIESVGLSHGDCLEKRDLHDRAMDATNMAIAAKQQEKATEEPTAPPPPPPPPDPTASVCPDDSESTTTTTEKTGDHAPLESAAAADVPVAGAGGDDGTLLSIPSPESRLLFTAEPPTDHGEEECALSTDEMLEVQRRLLEMQQLMGGSNGDDGALPSREEEEEGAEAAAGECE